MLTVVVVVMWVLQIHFTFIIFSSITVAPVILTRMSSGHAMW